MKNRLKYVTVHHASGVGVADRYLNQYRRNGAWVATVHGDSEAIYNALCALGPTPTPSAVADVIGNKSWSYIGCDGCGEYVARAVALGEYEIKNYCETCIREAAGALDADASA